MILSGRSRVVVAVVFGLAGGGSVATGAIAAPIEQHLEIGSNVATADATNGIDVVWTDTSCSASSVQYGATSAYGSTASETVAPFAIPGETSCSHHVRLAGLSAGATYHYAVPAGADHTFTTASPGAGSFVFVAYGDQGSTSTVSGSAGGGCGLGKAVGGSPGVAGVPESTALQAAAAAPMLALYLGDCAYGNGTSSAPWDAWFTANVPLAADVAWLAAVGNHDEAVGQGPGMATDDQNFYGRFFFPAPFATDVGWWSVDVGGVHFIFLSGDRYGAAAQTTWLDADLGSAAATGAAWRIAVVHQPAFSSSCYGGDAWEDGVRSTFVPIFDAHATTAHVDLVLQGHRHVYERTYMLRAGPSVDTADYDAVTHTYTMPATAGVGTVYVTTGAGGHSLHGWLTATPPAWSAARRSFYHWLKFAVSPGTIVVEVHETQSAGAVWETFSIARSPSGADGADAPEAVDASDGVDAPDGAMDAGSDGGVDPGEPPADPQAPDVADAIDAGSDPAGQPPVVPGGCSCSTASPVDWIPAAIALLAIAFYRRRRAGRPKKQHRSAELR